MRKLEITLAQHTNAEHAAGWLSKALLTITSDVFAELTVCIPAFYTTNENQVHGWNPVDDVLDRFSSCADVTLVVRHRVVGHELEDLIRKHFPLMQKNGEVVLEVPPPDIDDQLLSEFIDTLGY